MHLSIDEARRIAVRAALLDENRPARMLDYLHHVGTLRIELTPTVAPAADHIGWSRVGQHYRPAELEDALANGTVFERSWMLHPVEDLGLYLGGMRTWAQRAGVQGWLEANADFAAGILTRIAADGPQTSREIPDEAAVPWTSTGWTNNRNVTQMLEVLHMTGALAVVAREGRLRVWDLASRVFPEVEEVPADEARWIRSQRLLDGLGIMRESNAVAPGELHTKVELVGEPATIEGVKGAWRVDPTQLDKGFTGRTTLLSPFDRLMVDRARLERLFEFDYTLEMFKPESKRMWGQFALPILHGDRLVGKLDARTDRKRGRFVVHRIHEDEPFDPETREAVEEQIDLFAAWLDLERTDR